MCRALAAWRTESGLSQRALAKKLRRAPSIIAKIETGDRRLDVVEFAKWCRAVGVDPPEALRQLKF